LVFGVNATGAPILSQLANISMSAVSTFMGSLLGLTSATSVQIALSVPSITTMNAGDSSAIAAAGTDAQIAGDIRYAPIATGHVIAFAGTTAPAGYLACPVAAATISRTTYSALFAAIGTAWGVGNGSTTFGIPFFAADQVPVQAGTGVVGTNTVGVVLAHTHTVTGSSSTGLTGGGASAGLAQTNTTSAQTPTGGTSNLAAGQRVQFCVKY
jgi:hypothetical protein